MQWIEPRKAYIHIGITLYKPPYHIPNTQLSPSFYTKVYTTKGIYPPNNIFPPVNT